MSNRPVGDTTTSSRLAAAATKAVAPTARAAARLGAGSEIGSEIKGEIKKTAGLATRSAAARSVAVISAA